MICFVGSFIKNIVLSLNLKVYTLIKNTVSVDNLRKTQPGDLSEFVS